MKLSIKRRTPKQRRTIKRFLILPMRWDENIVVWLEWIEVDQVRDVLGMWVDSEYHLNTCTCDASHSYRQ